jgi:hypothetical protein
MLCSSRSRILVAALALCCAGAQAATYRCPSTYPGDDAPALPLTGASMMWGERPSSGPPYPSGWDTPNDVAAEEGLDQHYELPADEERWFICEYGSRKRIKGRVRNGHEWGQYMQGHGEQVWFLKLAPKDASCTVHTREVKTHQPTKSTWMVTATCKQTP